MTELFNGIYNGKIVLITGHTGFKGSWLSYWLSNMGANVIGYSLSPPTSPNHFELISPDIVSIFGDIRDSEKLCKVFSTYNPDIVFHLAAQPLVRLSYDAPVETYETNVIGTLKVFEACRSTRSVKAIVNITSDKCYENREWVWGYRENDPMGGYDPYSASKGCAEILTNSYRNSFFKSQNILLASCRAGNVVGGGDWAKDRLLTDIINSACQGGKVSIRCPKAIRPWQHVLEPLSGYLLLGQQLLEGKTGYAEGWNFGPSNEGSISVEEVVRQLIKEWDKINYEISPNIDQLHEAKTLRLDCSKAQIMLKWKNVWDAETTFKKTAAWYKAFYEDNLVLTHNDLVSYVADAKTKKLVWTIN